MNIYEEIERYYLNINPAIRTDNFLRRIYAIIAFIGIIVAFL